MVLDLGSEMLLLGEGADSREKARAVLQEIWDANPLLRQFLGEVDNPELVLDRIDPVRVRYMQEWALQYHEVPLGDR